MKKTLLGAILSIAMCLSLISGATFALFTSESKVNIAISSGTVAVEANISDVMLKDLNEATYTRTVTEGQTVGFESSAIADTRTVTFTDGDTLSFANIVPGDAVKFNVNVINESTVSIQYRVKIVAEGELFAGLLVKTDGDAFLGKTYTAWKTLSVNTNGDSIAFEISLPDTGNSTHDNKFQGKTCSITVTVEAVQGNAETFNDTNAGAVVDTQVNAAGKVETTADAQIEANGFSAEIPAGTVLKDNATTATLTIVEEEANAGDFAFEATGAEVIGLNISIPEVEEENAMPITITLANVLEANLNGVMLYHKGVAMIPAENADEVDEDGEFYYDATTGNITFVTTNFSNFTIVVMNSAAVSSEAELTAAINAGKNVVFASDITLSKTLMIKKNVVIDLNGYTLDTATNGSKMLQLSSDTDPSVMITSSKEGAEINAGVNAVALAYGALDISNVTINVGEVKTSSVVPFQMYNDLTLGKGTIVNVDFLGTSLISNSGAANIVIDGAIITASVFKVNGSAMISISQTSKVAIENSMISVGLDMTYTSYFISRSQDNVTVENTTFTVVDAFGLVCGITKVVNDDATVTYAWSNAGTAVATEAELTAAIAAGKSVKLTANIALSKTLEIRKDVVINLNGFTLSTTTNGSKMLLSYANVAVVSYKSGATVEAGNNSFILAYGATTVLNVTVNFGTTNSTYVPFNVRNDLTLGAETVINVEKLESALISVNAQANIVIDGVTVNVDTFKVNAGAVITTQRSTIVAIENSTFNIGLDTTYTSYFLMNAKNAIAMANNTFNVVAGATTYNGVSARFDSGLGYYKYDWANI